MAEYDLPASVAHALAVSNASTLAYVGHSQGTSIAFAALASQPALAAKVQAPRHVNSTVHLLIFASTVWLTKAVCMPLTVPEHPTTLL